MTGFRFKSMSHRVSRAASLLAIMLAAVAPIATGIGSGPFVAPTDRVGTSAVAPPREIGTDAVWQVGGAEAGDYLGYSIATAGDVNGDGYGDVIIGAPRHSNPQVYEGAAFLYLGSAGGLSTAPAWSYESNQIGAGFGICVAPAGDVNNDGYADVIVGADTYDIGQSEEGCAFVFLGSSSGLAPTPIWTGQGDQAGAQYGLCVATAGDVNGDGYDDILVGAPFYDNSSSDDGRAYLYYGAAYGVESDFAWAIGSGQTSAQLGRSVATAGDVNADGYADIIIGADRYDAGLILDCGRAWVYLGSSTGIAGGYVWVQTGVVSGDHFGWCVAAAGDTDGDGYADVVVGAPEADGSLVDEGRIYVYRGTPTGVAIPPMRTLSGGQTNARYGTSVAPAGDTNGDSFADLVVGARPTKARSMSSRRRSRGSLPPLSGRARSTRPTLATGRRSAPQAMWTAMASATSWRAHGPTTCRRKLREARGLSPAGRRDSPTRRVGPGLATRSPPSSAPASGSRAR